MQFNGETGQNSFEWILIAKGVGIVLVVIGHFYPQISPAYWIEIRQIIYSFHMPLFFIISGYLYRYGKNSYRDLIKIKVKRLLYPFVTIAGFFYVIKYLAGQVVVLEYPVNLDSLYTLLADPVNSYVPLLWFVHALFLIFALYPLLRLFLNNISILMIMLFINAALGSEFLVFGKALANLPFFLVGVMIRERGDKVKALIGSDWHHVFAPFLLFVFAYILLLSFNMGLAIKYFIQFILSIAGSLFVINLSQVIAALSETKIKEMLLQIGYYSMSIYLLHTLFESTVKIGFLQVFRRIQTPFELIAITSITCGIVCPLVLEKTVLRKYSGTRKFLLGLS